MKRFILVLAVLSIATTGCEGFVPWVKANYEPVMKTVTPYLVEGCLELRILPEYKVSKDKGTGEIKHYVGGMIGGCGKLVEIECDIDAPEGVEPCEKLKLWVENNPDEYARLPVK